jgi:uncharacterized membrane protein YkvA (DUF1232 family)
MENNEELQKNEYSKEYSENSLFEKILQVAKKAGINVIYAGLLLFYTLQKPLTPGWARATIIGALGYFISPIDAIPDLTPIAGYTDDLGALALALAAVSMFIDDDVKSKAREKLKEWFGDYDDSSLEEIDNKINK